MVGGGGGVRCLDSPIAILGGSYQEPGKDHRDGNGRHAGRTHHNHVRQVVLVLLLQFAVGDQQLVFAGVLGEFQHFDVVPELDLGRFSSPEEVTGIATLQAPDRLLWGDG